MRILILTQVPPNPPDAGPKIKTHYLIRTLSQEHEIELITYVRNEGEEAAAYDLEPYCERITTVPLRRDRWREPLYALRGWTRRKPFLVERDNRREMQRVIEQRIAAGGVDVLHADQLPMAQFLPLARSHGVKTIFDAHNAVWDLVRSLRTSQPTPIHRLAAEVEWRLLRRFERDAARQADAVLCVSKSDLELLGSDLDEMKTAEVVPIGVEVRDVPTVEFSEDANHLLSVSTLHYPPNASALRWFRDEVWSRIRQGNADIELDVVGHRPPDDILRWGASDSRVTVHGYVPELEPYYQRAAIFIAPLLAGSGIRVKILEAMARGIPVVTTPIGADGLDVENRRHLIIVSDPREFATSVQELIGNPRLRQDLAREARKKVLEVYDWRSCCRPALDLYQQLSKQMVTQAVSRTPAAPPDVSRVGSPLE